MTTLVVMAKECVPGRVKTRLTPPFTPEDAARIAAASLADTLAFASALPVDRRILAFEGTPPRAPEFDVVPQAAGGLDERIAAVLDSCREPVLLIGMDTPQLTRSHVAAALADLGAPSPRAEAWIGPASDGGYWALGLRHPDGALVRGVPMSREDTGARQRDRLAAAGLRIGTLPMLTDLDDERSLREVREAVPAGALRRLFAAADAPQAASAAGARS